MTLQKDLREFVELLNSNDVRYLIVGAHAVAYHGRPRFTGDIDIFVERSSVNAERILAALSAFGMGSLDLSEDDLTAPDKVIQLGVDPNRIDILTSITGVEFGQAWQNRVDAVVEGLPMRIIGKADLIANKRAVGRDFDFGDLRGMGETIE